MQFSAFAGGRDVAILGMSALGSNCTAQVPAIPKLISTRYHDVEAQAASVPNHSQSYSQLTAGRFEGVLHSHVISARAALFVEATNCSIRKQFCVLPGHLRIAYLLDEAAKCNVNGARMHSEHLFINLPMTEIDLNFGEDHRAAWITLDYEQIRRQMHPDEEPRGLQLHGRLQSIGQAGVFRQLLATAQQEFFKPGTPEPHSRTVAAFERVLYSLAAWTVSTVLNRDVEARRLSATHRAYLLRRAYEVIDGKLTEGLTMSELCQMIGASRRTLESIFVEALDMSPYQYVRALRLNAVRKALLSEENANRAIGDVASHWGIWHLSRFAADYRNMFGELPSQTRCRLRSTGAGQDRPRQ